MEQKLQGKLVLLKPSDIALSGREHALNAISAYLNPQTLHAEPVAKTSEPKGRGPLELVIDVTDPHLFQNRLGFGINQFIDRAIQGGFDVKPALVSSTRVLRFDNSLGVAQWLKTGNGIHIGGEERRFPLMSEFFEAINRDGRSSTPIVLCAKRIPQDEDATKKGARKAVSAGHKIFVITAVGRTARDFYGSLATEGCHVGHISDVTDRDKIIAGIDKLFERIIGD